MTTTLGQLAALVGGRVLGDSNRIITGAATIRDARTGDITLAESSKFVGLLAACPAAAVVVPDSLSEVPLSAIAVADAQTAFCRIVTHFRPQVAPGQLGVSPQAFVSPTARLGEHVAVHPGATIGDNVEIGARSIIHAGVRILAGCRIGEDSILFPNAVLYENTQVGPRVIIHAGAVIGAYGFGYSLKAGRHVLSPQLGNVEIGADVEIGAGTTIDRGTYGPTTIGEGTKIDNQVMIGHNCRIGRHNMLCSQVGIAGSCVTGDFVVMAGQVGIRDHVTIGDRAVLGAKSGVMSDLPADQHYLGAPAIVEREEMRVLAALAKLPELRKELRQLRRQLENPQAAESPTTKSDAA